MTKIVLCGATHGSNFGDTIFAYMFYKYLTTKFSNVEFRFTEVSEYTRTYLAVPEINHDFLATADGLIFISGGYFGESHDESLRGAWKRYQKYIRYGRSFVRRKRRIAIAGVGAGPLSSKILRNNAVNIFNYADVASVRDPESKEFLENAGVNNRIKVTSDSAQAIGDAVFQLQSKSLDGKLPLSTGKKNVLVHVSEAIDYEMYKRKVLVPLSKALPNNVKVIVTNDVLGNDELLTNAAQCFSNFECATYSYTDPFKFIDLISKVDSIITPKLHVGIFGATFKKPVIALPLHPEKTLRYYKQIGYLEHAHSLFELDQRTLVKMVTRLLWEPVEVDTELVNLARSNFEMLDQFVLNIERN